MSTVLKSDLEEWFSQPLIIDDAGELEIREAAWKLAQACLTYVPQGHDQQHAILRIRETCLLACSARRPSLIPLGRYSG